MYVYGVWVCKAGEQRMYWYECCWRRKQVWCTLKLIVWVYQDLQQFGRQEKNGSHMWTVLIGVS